MAIDFSLANSVLKLNGHTFSGWSEDEDALSIEFQEVANVTYGADGKMTSVRTGNKGGLIVLKFKANSSSVIFLSSLFEQFKKGVTVVFSGILLQSVNNTSLTFADGTFVGGQPNPTMGKGATANMEYHIAFETIAGNFVNANFV